MEMNREALCGTQQMKMEAKRQKERGGGGGGLFQIEMKWKYPSTVLLVSQGAATSKITGLHL